jgi:hypothetical protein
MVAMTKLAAIIQISIATMEIHAPLIVATKPPVVLIPLLYALFLMLAILSVVYKWLDVNKKKSIAMTTTIVPSILAMMRKAANTKK